jgi:hypothetical protein
MNFATKLMRSRTELMFQVEMVRCIANKCHCERSEAIPRPRWLWIEIASASARTRFGGLETRP